jgi:hypothetical protein
MNIFTLPYRSTQAAQRELGATLWSHAKILSKLSVPWPMSFVSSCVSQHLTVACSQDGAAQTN